MCLEQNKNGFLGILLIRYHWVRTYQVNGPYTQILDLFTIEEFHIIRYATNVTKMKSKKCSDPANITYLRTIFFRISTVKIGYNNHSNPVRCRTIPVET